MSNAEDGSVSWFCGSCRRQHVYALTPELMDVTESSRPDIIRGAMEYALRKQKRGDCVHRGNVIVWSDHVHEVSSWANFSFLEDRSNVDHSSEFIVMTAES